MQLCFDIPTLRYRPPQYQLLKWVGSKHRLAAAIAQHFPSNFGAYFEPFLGSGSVLATVAPKRGLGSDLFQPLMQIWSQLKNDPETLVEWYASRRNRLVHESAQAVYESVKQSFNTNPNGPDFLYLTRSCYGGIIRFR